MKNAKFLLAALAIALVFGMTSCGNKDEATPLNGTWKADSGQTIKFSGKNFEMVEYAKGTLTISGDKITLTPTHFWLDKEDAEGFGLTPTNKGWYTTKEIIDAYVKLGESAEDLEEEFAPGTFTYVIDGNTLTLTDEDGHPQTWTKQ